MYWCWRIPLAQRVDDINNGYIVVAWRKRETSGRILIFLTTKFGGDTENPEKSSRHLSHSPNSDISHAYLYKTHVTRALIGSQLCYIT